MPKRLSVIIPAYQHASTLPACLDRVLAQTRKPDEVIVVDDGSTDETADILERYRGRVTAIHQENQGGNAARNRGFAASTGELVIFCDADVIMRPDMLEILEHALETRPWASYAYSGFRFGWKSFPSRPFDADRLRDMNYIHTTALIKREHFPGFDPAIRRFQDWDVWLTMLEQEHIGVRVPHELFHVLEGKGRRGISQWRPSLLYQIPWNRLGWMPTSIRKYEEAKVVIRKKHRLN